MLVLGAALLLFAAPASAEPVRGAVEAPATQHVGAIDRIFQEWLSAFNSNDAAVIKAFYKSHLNDPNPVFAIENAEDSCGLRVDRIVQPSPTKMIVLLRQRCLPGLQRAKVELEPTGKLKAVDATPLALPGDGASRPRPPSPAGSRPAIGSPVR